MEADLHAEYGVDLLDFWRGKLSPRKVFRLIRMLPDTSRTAAQMSAGTDDPQEWRRWVGWGEDRRLLHAAVAVHLSDRSARQAWDKALPRRSTARSGSLQSFAPGRQ